MHRPFPTPTYSLSHILARYVWWGMLWFMRRRPIKGFQRAILRLVETLGGKPMESFKAQNRWARRYGLPLVQVAIVIFLASILITICSSLTIKLYESGAFQPPFRESQ